MTNLTSQTPKIRAKLIIFDFDGTLADTVGSIADGANLALARLGLPQRELSYVRSSIGTGSGQLAWLLLPEEMRNKQNAAKVSRAYREAYDKTFLNLKELFPGMTEVLCELHGRGIKLAVFSNKPDKYVKKLCELLIPAGLISAAEGQIEGRPIKPDPTGALEICRRLCISPSDTAMVGDGETDVEVALRTGMTPVSVTWGYRSREWLKEAGGKIFVDRVEDLPDLFE